jgi:hypothetical protein
MAREKRRYFFLNKKKIVFVSSKDSVEVREQETKVLFLFKGDSISPWQWWHECLLGAIKEHINVRVMRVKEGVVRVHLPHLSLFITFHETLVYCFHPPQVFAGFQLAFFFFFFSFSIFESSTFFAINYHQYIYRSHNEKRSHNSLQVGMARLN